jgi:DNA ligase-1
MSRNLKPIRNKFIQAQIGHPELAGLDGELIVGAASGELVYNRTNSGVMSGDGTPDFKYYVFDSWNYPTYPYAERLLGIDIPTRLKRYIEVLPQAEIQTSADLGAYEIEQLDAGYEGIMVRSVDGCYKYGRSTENEGLLWKVKRFEDFEAEVIGFGEAQHNGNLPTVDGTGKMVRSKHQLGMIGAAMIGMIRVKRMDNGAELNLGPGTMTHAERKFFWEFPTRLMGRMIKGKVFAYGTVDEPRFGRFHGFCDPEERAVIQ